MIEETAPTDREIAQFGLMCLFMGIRTPAELAALATSPDPAETMNFVRNDNGVTITFTVDTARRIISEIIRNPERLQSNDAILSFMDQIENAS